jgi:DNA-binding NarL/FixJ family response regulator
MSSKAIRLLLVDDHTLVRAGVRRILESHEGIRVVGEVSDGEGAIEALSAGGIDVVVLDLTMPDCDGFALLAEMRRRWPAVKPIVLTMHSSGEYVARSVREGAKGYLLKDSAVHDLVAAIETVVLGGEYYSPSVQGSMADALRREGGRFSMLDQLTEREREVLRLVAEGLATKEIAARLFISTRTVESHRANLMRKLDLRSVALLTQFAIREGLVRHS